MSDNWHSNSRSFGGVAVGGWAQDAVVAIANGQDPITALDMHEHKQQRDTGKVRWQAMNDWRDLFTLRYI